MSESLLIDVTVIALLGATIYFAFRLDRRLQSIRNVQNELAGVIRELNTAAARAEAGIQGLKMAAQSSGQQLEQQIHSARVVGDELAILLKSSERVGRVAETVRVQPVPPPVARPQPVVRQTSALDALRSLSHVK
jgi:uncharacterized membrane protein YdfJ with MMPL/SSD domain